MMRAAMWAMVLIGLGGAASAQTSTLGANPGQAATERVLDPAKPAPVAPSSGTAGSEQAAAMSNDDMRALLEAARATAKATRESVDYSRVVPDILTQMLTKLDKIEDKLDRIETALKAGNRKR